MDETVSALGEQRISAFLGDLAARRPAPGGGAAAAMGAALGCAAGAMAARYTTGVKWSDREVEAVACSERLDAIRHACLALAEADGAAFAAAQAARITKDPVAIARTAAAALAVPAELIQRCSEAVEVLAAFAPRCNPYLLSDVRCGVHLLSGAARAAWVTFLINQPPDDLRQAMATHLAKIGIVDSAMLQAAGP